MSDSARTQAERWGRCTVADIETEQFRELFEQLSESLDDDNLDALIHKLTRHTHEAGDTLIEEGEVTDEVLLIWAGDAVVLSSDGREVATVGRGSMIGEVSLVDPGPASATVQCSSDVVSLALDRDTYEILGGERPAVATAFLRQMGRQVARRMRSTTIALNTLSATTDASPPQPDAAEAGGMIGDYRVESVLGSGGFATVWLGHDERLDGKVAIKVLADNWVHNDEIRERFLEEARFMWRADDPRIITVHAVGELPSGQPYFVMEHAARGALDDRFDALTDPTSPGALTCGERIGLVAELARCVEAVHRLDAIHRDVKPGNFLIRETKQRDEPVPGLAVDERVLITDFGLAKSVIEGTGASIAGGSPGYMAPEQARLEAMLDTRADVFALAAIAYQFLAGELPYKMNTALLGKSTPAPVVSESRSGIPTALDAPLLRALQSEPEDRTPDVQSFLTDLADATDGVDLSSVPGADQLIRLESLEPQTQIIDGPIVG